MFPSNTWELNLPDNEEILLLEYFSKALLHTVILFQRNLQWDTLGQEPISRSMQPHYIPVTAFSYLFLDRISLKWDSHGSAMINHKKVINVIASLDRNYLSLTKENGY